MLLNLLLALLLAAALALAGLLYAQQRKLLYFPDKGYMTPRDLGLENVREVAVKTRHTKRLLAWYAPAREGRPTLVYFHGNGGSLASRAPRLKFWQDLGFGMLLTTYRGYSGSSDGPAETPIKLDALYFYHWLQAQGVPEDRIILYGESLGTGVALSTALNHNPLAVVLEAPYSSIADVAAHRFWPLPVRPFLKDRYDNMRLIGRIEAPLLVVHGEADQVIPIRFARKLFDAAGQPKEAAWLSDAAHNDLYSKGAAEIILRFIQRQM